MRKGFLCDASEKISIAYSSGFSVMTHSHIHSQWELYFCPDRVGQSSVINGVRYEYCFPCAILSRPYTIHSMSCAEDISTDPKWDRYVFYFSDEMIEGFSAEMLSSAEHQGILFELTDSQADYLRGILEQVIGSEYKNSCDEQRFLLGFFISKLFNFCKDERITKVGATSFYVQDVMKSIAEDISEPINADALARRFAVSRSKLDRDFKEAVGMTVHDFFDVCRINYAKSLLQSKKNMTLAEISDACGFKSETYFFSYFKKHTGSSPSDFRRGCSGKRKQEKISDCE